MTLQVQDMEIEKIHPWEANPRLNDQAMDAVAESIRLKSKTIHNTGILTNI